MPDQTGRLGRQERTFAAAFAVTGDKTYAATKAGYSQPAVGAHRALSRPAVLAEIAKQQQERLFSDVLPAAIQCLSDIITNDKAPAGARVQAAKVVLDRTLGVDDPRQGKEPHEMTGEELARAIAELERIASDRAKPVAAIEEAAEDVFA